MIALSKTGNSTITDSTLCECRHPARLHRDGKECHGLFCHCEDFKTSNLCPECRGRGVIEIIDSNAEQREGMIVDEKNHEEICINCKGTGKIKLRQIFNGSGKNFPAEDRKNLQNKYEPRNKI